MAIYLSSIINVNSDSIVAGGGLDWKSDDVTTANSNSGYIVDTSLESKSIDFPLSPKNGDIVAFADMKGTFSTNNLIITRNGHKIMGIEDDMTINIDNISVSFVYNDGDWRVVSLAA